LQKDGAAFLRVKHNRLAPISFQQLLSLQAMMNRINGVRNESRRLT